MDPRELVVALGDWSGGPGPLYRALASRLGELARRGKLPPGTRLPSERRLADALWVSRGTVVRAYELLREKGLARSRRGSGTVIVPEPHGGPAEATGPLGPARLSSVHELWGVEPAPDGLVDFRPAAWPDADGLPREAFRLPEGELDAALSTHGYAPAGLPRLREAIAARYRDAGLDTVPEQILVTGGGQQAIALLVRLLLTPLDVAVVEELTFPGARDVLTAAGARVRTAPLGPDGVLVDHLARAVEQTQPRLVYLIPTGHNPTGSVLPEAARRTLVGGAREWRTLVVDDRVLAGTLPADGQPPSLAVLARGTDAEDRIVTVESMSKVFWGGLRVGWVRGPRSLIGRLAGEKTLDDLGSPVMSQLVAARLLPHEEEVRALRAEQRRRRLDALEEELARALPEWWWSRPEGGLSLWIRLPEGDGEAFARVAGHYDVAVTAGVACSPDGRHTDHIRMACTQPAERAAEGVRRLAAAWRDYTRGPASVPAATGVVV